MKPVILIVVVVLALLAVAAGAATTTVTVTPLPFGSDPADAGVGKVGVGQTTCTNGWRLTTNALGFGKLCNYGPSTYQSRTGGFFAQYLDWYNDVWYPDTNLGQGAFLATCDEFKGTFPELSGDKTPSTVWLGTDTWNGAALHGRTLGSITQMDYYSFCGKIPVRRVSGTAITDEQYWNWSNNWNGPQQPIQLQLMVESPDGTEMRQLWYRPWGYNYVGDDGMLEISGCQRGRWQRFNCLLARPTSQGKWYTPRSQSVSNDPDSEEAGWTTWAELMASSLKAKFPSDPAGDTPARVATFSNWKLADPAHLWKSPGWDGQTSPAGSPSICTGTGMPLNFFVGTRKSVIYPMFLNGQGNANGSYGFRGQVDYFTLGFGKDGNNQPIAETYNFEPAPTDPPLQVVATTCAMWNQVLGDTSKVWPAWPWLNQHPIAASPGFAQQPMPLERTFARTTLSTPTEPERGFLVKITGKVLDPPPHNGAPCILIDDGSDVQYQTLTCAGHWDGPAGNQKWVIDTYAWGPLSSLDRSGGTLIGGVRVHLPDDRAAGRPAWDGNPLWISPGDTVSVIGYVEPPLFWSGAPMLWTNISLVQKIEN
jgi:hypothetical protein